MKKMLCAFALVSMVISSSIYLFWNRVAGAESYQLRRTEANREVTVYEGSGSSFTDTKVKTGIIYRYAVRAVGENGEGEWSNSVIGYLTLSH